MSSQKNATKKSIFKKRNIKDENRVDSQHTVMLVDDEPNILSELGSFLEDEYRVIAVESGKKALELLRNMNDSEFPALIICDQMMPQVTGVEFFAKVVEENLAPDTLRILLTGQVELSVVLDAINKVFLYKFIFKPFETEEFVESIKSAVEVFDERRKRRARERGLERRLEELTEENRELRTRLEALTGGKED